MTPYTIEKTITAEGVLLLENLPFQPGEIVRVVILQNRKEIKKVGPSLKGTLLRYDQPFDPIDVDEWEALQ